MQQKKCEICNTLNPMSNMGPCIHCGASMALVGIYQPTKEDEDVNQKMYVECLVCGTRKYIKNENEIIRRCECCGDD